MEESEFKTGLIKVACRTCKGEKIRVIEDINRSTSVGINPIVNVSTPCTDCKGTGYYEVKKL